MKDNTMNTALEKYLSKLEKHLKCMPVSEKEDILRELEDSFCQRMENGQSVEEIIAEMGSPKVLAADYIGSAIVKNHDFSFRRLMMLFAYYSLASTAWLILIPTLAVLAVSFFFTSGVSIVAGVMGVLKGIVHIPVIDTMRFIFFTYELTGVPALLIGLLLAALSFVLGIICWKATIGIVRFVQRQRCQL